MPSAYSTPATLAFLMELAQNNHRAWFEDNKSHHEDHVRTPALAFIADMAPVLNAFAPGYYLHVEADSFFLGVGIWRPDAQALGMIRDAAGVGRHYTLSGEALQNPPHGYAKDHPQLQDLKRKDFIAIKTLSRKDVLSSKLPTAMAAHFAKARPFMRFLCGAERVGFD
jgi:uncharacterized protein (DUF2461 family)